MGFGIVTTIVTDWPVRIWVRDGSYMLCYDLAMSDDPLQPHSHDNNLVIPGEHTYIDLYHAEQHLHRLTIDALAAYPQSSLTYSYTTDHGPHGPYVLSGVALIDVVPAGFTATLREIEVISADGFGNRIFAEELGDKIRPILLATHSDRAALSRQNGLVRLVVPSETDNALRQIKWVQTLRLVTA